MSRRRAELLDAALRYLVESGVANVSLRPMAAALGTSPRILMFHFESKEGLLRSVLEELNARLQASLRALASAEEPGTSRAPPLRRFWLWANRKENFAYFRLLYEVQIVALQNPRVYGRYLKNVSDTWQATALELMSPSLGDRAMVSLCIAVFDGLMLERMSGGDQQGLTEALDRFIAMATRAPPARGARAPARSRSS
jgi:AcrR family transcriptional regulator